MKNEFGHAINQLKDFLPITIVGMGLTGDAILNMLLLAGIDRDQIKTFDEKILADYSDPVKMISEFKPKSLLVSPGIPLSKAWIQNFSKTGGRITSEVELASYFLKSEKMICITGSIGKSTTTALIAAAALVVDPNRFIGGNFGIPLGSYISKILQGQPRAKYVILELSSFQLENYSNLKTDVGVLTFLSPNHMERYSSLNQYYETKLSLIKRTKDIFFLNSLGGDILKNRLKIENMSKNLKLSFLDREYLKNKILKKPKIIGEHNLDNLALALAVADFFRWPEYALTAMIDFPGLSHRLENLGEHAGILFLNDSKATAIDSVLEATHAALNLKNYSGKIHLLLGGRDKNLPWETLSQLKSDRFEFYFFGEYGEMAQKKSGLSGTLSEDLHACLPTLGSKLKASDIVLLSPGGTSLDEFKGFEDRGNFFKKWVDSEFQN